MSVIIRLQNLPLTANSIDIRNFFRGLSIPDGGVHIVGGSEGDAFIAFSTDEDARQAMQLTGQKLKDSSVKLLLSSRNEMFKVIEQARLQALGLHPQGSPSSIQGGENSTSSQSSSASSNTHQPANVTSNLPPLRSPDHTNVSQGNPMMINNGNNTALPTPSGQPVGNMPGFPAPTMNIPTGNPPNHFMPPGLMAGFPGIPNGPPPLQQQPFPNLPPNPQGMFNNRAPNPSVNPFIIPPNMPSMGNPMGFPGMMPNNINNGSSNSPANIASGMGTHGGMNNSSGMLGMPGLMNPSGPAPGVIPGAFNVGGPRMGAMNNPMGMSNNSGMNGPGGSGNNFMGMGHNNFPPFMGGAGGNISNAGAPTGGMGPGSRPPRPNFNPHNQQHQHRPTGPMSNNMPHNNSPRDRNLGLNVPSGGGMGGHNRDSDIGNPNQHRDRDSRETKRRSRSRSRERRDREIAARLVRRRSRSRSRERVEMDRSRDKDRDRRRRRSRSKSRSRSRDRGGRPGRRISRDREKSRDERRKSDSSPEKSSDKAGSAKRESEKRGRRDSDPVPNSNNITDEEHPCIKLMGLPKDASFREIREFVRVDIQGGGEGVVRHFEEGIAFLKLERPSDFPKVYRSNGRKLRNSTINIEGISFEKWAQEYKHSKKEGSRDRDRDSDRDRDRERDFRDRDRHDRDKNSSQRTSRFNNNANSTQSSCIAIRGLPPAITGKDVSSRLLRDAPVNDLLVVPAQGTNGRPTVTAFVSLENPTAAQRAVDSIVRSQEGASLIVELCELDDMNQARRTAPGSQSRDRDNRQTGTGAKSLFDLEIGMDIESSSVMLQGVPPNITDRDVFDFFSDIGLKPTNVRKLFDTHGTPNGQVICEFQDNHKALRATTKDGMMFGRNSISVTLIPSSGGLGEKPNFRNPHGGGLSRPSLLGVRPNGPGNTSQNPRFHNPNPNPNPFVQAMQQSMAPSQLTPGLGMRPSGPTRGMRNPSNNRMSRFDSRVNNSVDYDDFRESGNGSRNGVDRDDRVTTTTRARVHMSSNEVGPKQEKIQLFKPGCIVALTNVPFKAEIEDIAKFLEDVLKIQIPYERILRNLNDMGKSTGNARIAFQTPFEADLANDRLRGSTMWNRPIISEVLAEIVWS